MNTFKFIVSISFLCSFIFSSTGNAQAASDGFSRLFTTPQERKKLQILRNAEPESIATEKIEIPSEFFDDVAEEKNKFRDVDGIILNGIVYRKGGKSTAWLNGASSYEGSLTSEYLKVNTSDINSEGVSVTIPEGNMKFNLKAGQTYELKNEVLHDIVEDDVLLIINNSTK